MLKLTVFAIMLSGFILAGAGCVSTIDETSDAVITGAVKTPLAALDKAKQLSETEKARANRQAEESANYVTVALILTEGSEKPESAVLGPTIGCNDQVAMIQMSRVSDTGEVVIDALNTLFSQKDSSYKGYYNSLAFSDLKVLNKTIATDGVKITIRLEGELVSGGGCDDPRVKAQIEETVRYFYPSFQILLNGSEL